MARLVFGERLEGAGSAWHRRRHGCHGVGLREAPARGDLRGDFVVISSGIVFGIQTIAQKATFSKIPPSNPSVCPVGRRESPLFFLYSGVIEGFDSYHFSQQAILEVIYRSAGRLGHLLYHLDDSSARYPAGKLAAVAFLTPLFGVTFGHIGQGEPLTWPRCSSAVDWWAAGSTWSPPIGPGLGLP